MIPSLIQRIQQTIPDAQIDWKDTSGRHADHFKKAHDAPSHLELRVVSSAFEGLSLLQRHRLIHPLVYTGAPDDPHAVQLRLQTPSESSNTVQ